MTKTITRTGAGAIALIAMACLLSIAPRLAQAATTLFTDNFDQGGSAISANGWRSFSGAVTRTETSGSFTVGASSKGMLLQGSAGADPDDGAEYDFATMGFSELHVSYSRAIDHFFPGDSFVASYSLDDGSFIVLETLTADQAHAGVSFDIPNPDRHTKLTMHFFVNATSTANQAGVDNFELTGDNGPIFYDGFESNDFSAPPYGAWTTEETPAVLQSVTNHWTAGNTTATGHSANLDGTSDTDPDDAIQRTVDTSGFENIHVRFSRKVDNLATGENLKALYSTDGGTWTELGSYEDVAWDSVTFALPAAADDNANFAIRFELNGSGPGDDSYVDDVVVWGDAIAAPPATGVLVVKKVLINDDGGSSATSSFSFKVNGGSSQAFEADGENVLTVATGTYSIVEDADAGYTTTYSNDQNASANCDSLSITAGATTTCTITNDDVSAPPPTTGSIEITKYFCPATTTVNRTDNGFGGIVPAGCVPQTGAYFGYVHGTQMDASSPYPEWSASVTAGGSTNGSGVLTIPDLPTDGRHVVFETDSGNNKFSNSDLLGLYCEGDADPDPYHNDNGDITFVTAGATAHCVAYNPAPTATLNVIKHVVNNSGGDKSAGDWTLTVSSSNGGSGTGSAAGSEVGTTYSIDAGKAYSVSESGPGGYAESDSSDCSIASAVGGATYTCTITNDDEQGTLIIKKVLINDNGGSAATTSFSFKVNGGTSHSFNAAGDIHANVNAGSYSIVENAAAGYATTYANSLNGSPNCTSLAVPNGGTVTCTIINDDIAPKLRIVKHVINDNGGTAVASDWTMDVTAGYPSSNHFAGAESPGVLITVDVGAYSVDESGGPSGYAKNLGVGCSGSIALGETKNCVITNNDIKPVLTLRKKVVNDDGNNKVPANWTLTATGPTGFSGAGPAISSSGSFDAGTYDLSESGPPGYAASDWVCDVGQVDGDTVAVPLGTHVTCTIINDDLPPPPDACDTPGVAPAGYTLRNGTPAGDTVFLDPFTMFVGKGGNDIVYAQKPGEYIVCTEGGNDVIRLLSAGSFTIDAGDGTNNISVAKGNGIIKSGSGGDSITAGAGTQTIEAGDGGNTIVAVNGDKTITTGSGNDRVVTGNGDDTIDVGDGTNNVISGAGSDSITGGANTDFFNAGPGHDTCSAGAGFNTVLNCEVI